jgi:hypothetical protein
VTDVLTQDGDEMLRLDRADKAAEQRWRETMKGRNIEAMRAAAREYVATAARVNDYALGNVGMYCDR